MSDEGRKILKCSNCSREIVEIWVKNSNNKQTKIRAECCYCGDLSYVAEVNGEFYIGGTDIASIGDIGEKNGIQVIKTSKVRA